MSVLYFLREQIFMVVLCVVVLLCIITSSFCHSKIYFTLRYRQAQVSQQPGQSIPTRGGVKVQKIGVWLNVGIPGFDSLLSPICCNPNSKSNTRWNAVYCPCRGRCDLSSLPQLFDKSSYLLLGDERSKTSSKIDNQEILFFSCFKVKIENDFSWRKRSGLFQSKVTCINTL